MISYQRRAKAWRDELTKFSDDMTEDDEIKIRYLDPREPELETKLYSWGSVSTYVMTKAEYMELFGNVLPNPSNNTGEINPENVTYSVTQAKNSGDK